MEEFMVIIPVHNEAATLAPLLAELRTRFPEGAVVVVDDGSTDGSAEIAAREGAAVLRLPWRLGAWGAIQTGLRYARKRGARLAVTMDGDGQHLVSELPKLLAASRPGRVVIGAYPERGSRLRRIAWALFRTLSGFELRDLTSGLRVYDQGAIRLLASPRATLLDYQDLGVLLLLRWHRFELFEVPVQMAPRRCGKSRIFENWGKVARYLVHTLLLTLARR